jgi:hypothetical protein
VTPGASRLRLSHSAAILPPDSPNRRVRARTQRDRGGRGFARSSRRVHQGGGGGGGGGAGGGGPVRSHVEMAFDDLPPSCFDPEWRGAARVGQYRRRASSARADRRRGATPMNAADATLESRRLPP